MSKIKNAKQQVSKTIALSFLSAIIGVCVLIGFLSTGGCGTGRDGGAESKNAVKGPKVEPKWGPEVNGVCAAFEFVPEKGSYAAGETIGTMILIKNVSGKPVSKMETIGPSFYGHSVFTAVDANTPKLAEVNWLQEWKSDPNKMIEAGEVLAYRGAEIQVRMFNPDGTYPPRKAPNIVYFFPGEYNLYFKLDCGRKLALVTGQHKFVIVDANE